MKKINKKILPLKNRYFRTTKGIFSNTLKLGLILESTNTIFGLELLSGSEMSLAINITNFFKIISSITIYKKILL